VLNIFILNHLKISLQVTRVSATAMVKLLLVMVLPVLQVLILCLSYGSGYTINNNFNIGIVELNTRISNSHVKQINCWLLCTKGLSVIFG
jgi:hypothetical protein